MEAAGAICKREDNPKVEVGRGIESLADQSLLHQLTGEIEVRYQMLEMVREFALARLVENCEYTATRERHAQFFLALAKQEVAGPAGTDPTEWFSRLEREHDNLRAALDWLIHSSDQSRAGLRLAIALAPFWEVRGYLSEGRQWLGAAMEKTASIDGPMRARALYRMARFAALQGEHELAESLLKESLTISRELGSRSDIIASLMALGHAAIHLGDPGAAGELYEEALALHEEEGNKGCVATMLVSLADLALHTGDFARSRSLLEESLVIAREVGHHWTVAASEQILSYVLAEQGELDKATSLVEESLALFIRAGGFAGHRLLADNTCQNSPGAWSQGAGCANLCCGPSALRQERNADEPPVHFNPDECECAVAALRAELGEEAFTSAWLRGQQISPRNVLKLETATPTSDSVKSSRIGSQGDLTSREIEVLKLVASGLTNSQAAAKLAVSPYTVNMHLRSIYSKLDVSSRSAATRVAIVNRLVSPLHNCPPRSLQTSCRGSRNSYSYPNG